jgi:D-alanine--poly(phosphoribitol) ligase subunit 1
MPPKELKQFLAGVNNTETQYPEEKTISQLFEATVLAYAEQTAVMFKKKRLSYRELNKKVNSLARLLRQHGIHSGDIVAIMVERSLEMSIGLLAIIKAGGAYLPISPDTPPKRFKLMLSDSQASLILTQQKFISQIEKKRLSPPIRILDLEDEENYLGSSLNPTPVNNPRDLAYVIYTSGSTGNPKGVMIEHRSVINRLNWMQRKYPMGSGDIILQKTPFVFDVSVWEQFWWALVGGKVCFILPGFEKFPQAIVETIETNRISIMHFVPSMLSVFLSYIEHSGDTPRLSSLRYVFASGETLKPSHVKLFNRTLHNANGTRLINLYGPTEATVDVTYFNCPTAGEVERIPIGKPIDNTQMYILDNDLNPQPVGETGELHIGGVGLARGYLNRPQFTAEKFIHVNTIGESPVHLYKTGDLSGWLPDGNIMFMGRLDNQVKIRGLRIELGEIEAVLTGHPSIQDSAVMVKETSDTVITLFAYIVAGDKVEKIDVKKLKQYMKSYLPDYMIPAEYVILNVLPTTPNGKVDRKALMGSADTLT